ncbi:MAG TPA: amino acid racemase [Chitinophagaceae bacterium]|nr:amino acid racemase [Chitinophagaceae bacterium]
MKKDNTINRRETIALLASGLFSLHDLNNFNYNTISTNRKSSKKMKSASNNSGAAMKTIGIIGGIGPQATVDLEMRIHKVAQQVLPQAQNGGYPPMIVEYYRHPPIVVNENNFPVFPLQIDPRLLAVAKNLGTMSDFLVLPTNGVHRFQNEIESASGRKLLSIIDATMDEVKKRQWKKVGVLGLMTLEIYTRRLTEMGIPFETVSDDLQKKIDKTIFSVMEGRDDENDRAIMLEALTELRNKNVDGIIPGCTEIPLILGKEMDASDLVNPVQLLAEAAVKFAMS